MIYSSMMDLTKCKVETLRILMQQAYSQEDIYRARMNEAIKAQERISEEAARRNVLL